LVPRCLWKSWNGEELGYVFWAVEFLGWMRGGKRMGEGVASRNKRGLFYGTVGNRKGRGKKHWASETVPQRSGRYQWAKKDRFIELLFCGKLHLLVAKRPI